MIFIIFNFDSHRINSLSDIVSFAKADHPKYVCTVTYITSSWGMPSLMINVGVTIRGMTNPPWLRMHWTTFHQRWHKLRGNLTKPIRFATILKVLKVNINKLLKSGHVGALEICMVAYFYSRRSKWNCVNDIKTVTMLPTRG